MKKIFAVILAVTMFTSCDQSNIIDVAKDTEVPNIVYQSVNDTTLKPKYILVETEDKIFLINETTSKSELVEKVIEKKYNPGLWILLGIFVAAILFIFIASIID